jgi:hypothetical protein
MNKVTYVTKNVEKTLSARKFWHQSVGGRHYYGNKMMIYLHYNIMNCWQKGL